MQKSKVLSKINCSKIVDYTLEYYGLLSHLKDKKQIEKALQTNMNFFENPTRKLSFEELKQASDLGRLAQEINIASEYVPKFTMYQRIIDESNNGEFDVTKFIIPLEEIKLDLTNKLEEEISNLEGRIQGKMQLSGLGPKSFFIKQLENLVVYDYNFLEEMTSGHLVVNLDINSIREIFIKELAMISLFQTLLPIALSYDELKVWTDPEYFTIKKLKKLSWKANVNALGTLFALFQKERIIDNYKIDIQKVLSENFEGIEVTALTDSFRLKFNEKEKKYTYSLEVKKAAEPLIKVLKSQVD